MRKKRLFFFILMIFFGINLLSAFQFTKSEIRDRSKWENFLKNAKIISSETMSQGVTKPKKMLLRYGDEEAYGVWKHPSGQGAGVTDKWQAEIAAYKLDKFLGLNLVPPTVERKFKGRNGSLQLFINLEISELERIEQEIPFPTEKMDECEKIIYLARAFDSLIANTDRSQENTRYTSDWRLILIDHSRSFRSTRFFTDELIYGKYGMKKTLRFLKLPKDFVEKVKTLNYENIKKATAPYLTYDEINAVLTRKKLLLKEIKEMIEERGELQVLY